MLLGRMESPNRVTFYDPIQEAIDQELVRRKSEFTSNHQLSIFVGTWNVNAKAPGLEKLSPWIDPRQEGEPAPDIFAFGFQEIVDLSAQQV